MPLEIERKYLVSNLPDGWQEQRHEIIAQGYLFNTEAGVVRIRQKGDYFYQTIKKSGKLIREEIEFSLSESQFQYLWPYTINNRISKTRYYFSFKSYTIEVDLFAGDLEGLILAEVEFPSEKESNQFKPPDWFDIDVTMDGRYYNSYLATHGLPS
jgi:adenylate cyclase